VGLEKGLQVFLGAARLGENQRLARRARRGHLFEADVQRGEHGMRDGAGDSDRTIADHQAHRLVRLAP
jgi:hypothetical protein